VTEALERLLFHEVATHLVRAPFLARLRKSPTAVSAVGAPFDP
jgi:hypothetical protein